MSTPVIPRLDPTDLGPQHVYPRPAPPRVVITMPAYQSELTLEQTVLAIPEGFADELILVDDASRDGTADLARPRELRPTPEEDVVQRELSLEFETLVDDVVQASPDDHERPGLVEPQTGCERPDPHGEDPDEAHSEQVIVTAGTLVDSRNALLRRVRIRSHFG